jgi:deoxyribodipyrimidine photo-lyase
MIEQGRMEVYSYGEGAQNPKYVLYWMQQAQRVSYNHALNYAIDQANEYDLPLLVVFCVTPNYMEANARHYQFMLEGVAEVADTLKEKGIGFVLEKSHPLDGVLKYINDAKMLVMDKGYLRHQRQWREELVQEIKKEVSMTAIEIDTDLIVPVTIASEKAEHAARTIRPKLWRQYPNYDHLPIQDCIQKKWKIALIESIDRYDVTEDLIRQDYQGLLDSLGVDESVRVSNVYQGGYSKAVETLEEFFENKLNDYKDPSPVTRNTSRMGMYLHFGQISSLEILKRLYKYVSEQKDAGNHIDKESMEGFIEQVFIRRELAYNYVYYTEGYDQFDKMTDAWAYQTMAMHLDDEREYIYSLEELIEAKTHDPYWNDAMREMVESGYMHNYMRMYWCKKIVEWSKSYQEAYEHAIYLNNRYFIDGRDPNGYAGVAWCFGKHDHGWKERPIFGKLRYMNANGLKRKFKM